jgi:hypothetical protein
METLSTLQLAFTGRFAAMVERLYAEEPSLQGYQGTLESSIRMHFAQMGAQNHLWKRDTFRRLLLHMHAKRCYALLRNPAHIGTLASMSAFGNKMVRQPETWKKDSFTPEGQLASLIRHCFAQYDVPEFMEYVFAEDNKIHMLWYVQLGRGQSVQELSGFPVEFTKRMAHEFRETPKEFTVAQAIRRAQALGFGATVERAEMVAWSSLQRNFDNEAFRAEVIKFMANVPETLTLDVAEPVMEYIFSRQRQEAGFSMRGRAWAALERLSAEWHRDMARKREAEDYREWDIAVKGFRLEKGPATFKIVPLTDSVALYEEGYEMSHCVAEYVYDCIEGSAAIFSLRKFTKGIAGFETLATLEVCPHTSEIVQAKARFNESITTEAEEIVAMWAKRENLAEAYSEYGALPVAEPPPMRINVFDAPPQRPAIRATGSGEINWGLIAFCLIKVMLLAAKCSSMG